MEKINKEEKYVTVKNLSTGETYKENYDKLVLSPGAKPIVPNIPGIDEVNIFLILKLKQEQSDFYAI